jgi:hypothetical protein
MKKSAENTSRQNWKPDETNQKRQQEGDGDAAPSVETYSMDVFIRFLSIERVRETGRDCVRECHVTCTCHTRVLHVLGP